MFMEDEISGLDNLVATPPQKQRYAHPRYSAYKQPWRTEPSRGSPPVHQRLKHSRGSARQQPGRSGPSRDSAVGQPQMRPPDSAPVQALHGVAEPSEAELMLIAAIAAPLPPTPAVV